MANINKATLRSQTVSFANEKINVDPHTMKYKVQPIPVYFLDTKPNVLQIRNYSNYADIYVSKKPAILDAHISIDYTTMKTTININNKSDYIMQIGPNLTRVYTDIQGVDVLYLACLDNEGSAIINSSEADNIAPQDLDQTGTVIIQNTYSTTQQSIGNVGIDPSLNTVKIDSSQNTVTLGNIADVHITNTPINVKASYNSDNTLPFRVCVVPGLNGFYKTITLQPNTPFNLNDLMTLPYDSATILISFTAEFDDLVVYSSYNSIRWEAHGETAWNFGQYPIVPSSISSPLYIQSETGGKISLCLDSYNGYAYAGYGTP